MRDTLRLRGRIALLACMPGLAACSSPPAPGEGKGKPADRTAAAGDGDGKAEGRHGPLRDAKARREARKAAAEAKANAEPDESEAAMGEPVPAEGIVAPATHGGEPFIGFPGDPPYIDGYNPEEATCVSGNWCGAAAAAAVVGVPGVPEELGCAARLAGGKGSDAIKTDPKTYEGLSAAPNMQAALNRHGTELSRAAAGDDGMCCYHWFEYCSGRPLLGEQGPVVASAQPVEGSDAAWNDPALAGVEPPALPRALRQRIAQGWQDDALAEHASIASFARATLELMAVGAPPRLLADAQRAGLDEIEHARVCCSLASRYGGAAVQPGPLLAPAPRPASLPRLAADTFAEGCVGETIAALAAQRAARSVVEPAVKAALLELADDEARHAALAWSTVGWALEQGGAEVAQQLRDVAAALRPSPAQEMPAADPHATTLAAHGRLDARAQALAGQAAWTDIIEPMLERLLAAHASAHALA